jgi:DNA-binding PadR family transcriptional regulator
MKQIRVTSAVQALLDVLAAAPPGPVAWGSKICELTGYTAGTVYPALARLEAAGWVVPTDEPPHSTKHPPRRFYELTPAARDCVKRREAIRGQRLARAADPRTWNAPADLNAPKWELSDMDQAV